MNCAVFLTYRVSTGRHFSEFTFDTCCFYLRGFKQHKITYKNREENYFFSGPAARSSQFWCIRGMRYKGQNESLTPTIS